LQKRKVTLNFTKTQNRKLLLPSGLGLTQNANHTNFSEKSHLPRF